MPRSGQSWVQIATPTMAILIRPLTRFIQPSAPNRRLKPAMGETLEKSGVILSKEMLGRLCSTWPARPATIITAKKGASAKAICGSSSAHHGGKARAVHAHRLGLLEEQAQRARQADGGIFAEHGDGQGAAAQKNEGGDFRWI